MAEIASAYVSVLPSARGFGKSLNAQVGPQVNRAGAVAGAGFGKGLLKGFLAIGVLTKVTSFVGDSFAEAREAKKVGALVENAIKATGGAAKVSAAQVDRLSEAFSKKTGIDDEQIASSAALLLTFKNVRRVGEGMSNIFARATRASADLAASGFGSMESTAKQLGKALNDPLKGLSALGRAGVTFTAQQTKQIKAAVAANNTFRAQKIILEEVESQVGGAAEATATNADKAAVALANIKEQIGTGLLPILDRMSGTFVTKIAPAISGFITNLQSGAGGAGKFGAAVSAGLSKALTQGEAAFNRIRGAIKRNEPELRQIGNVITTKVIPAVATLTDTHLKSFGRALSFTIDTIGFTVRALNGIKDVITSVGNGISWAKDKFTAAKDGIANAARGARDAIQKYMGGALGPIRELIGLLQSAIDKFNELRGKSGGVRGPTTTGPAREGKRYTETLARGVASGKGALSSALEGINTKISESTKKMVEKLRSQLKDVRADFAGLKETVAGAFTSNLFEATTAGGFLTNLLDTKGQMTALKAAFTKLVGWGLKPEFLSQLFQSGNGGLILELASGSQSVATQAGSLFGEVSTLSSQLGASVADVKFGDKLDGIRDEIRALRKEQKGNAREVGREINMAGRSGLRRGKAAA